jgi:hypothetical protein
MLYESVKTFRLCSAELPNVQECDTTNGDSSNKADNIKKKFFNKTISITTTKNKNYEQRTTHYCRS